jgi:hypothetical protein
MGTIAMGALLFGSILLSGRNMRETAASSM